MLYSDAVGYHFEGNGFFLRPPLGMHTHSVRELAVLQSPTEDSRKEQNTVTKKEENNGRK